MWTPTAELPNLDHASGIVCDLETRDDGLGADLGSGWPWRGGYVVGVTLGTLDDDAQWYLPLRHEGGGNLPLESTLGYLRHALGRQRRWGYLFHGGLYDHGWGSTEGLTFPGLSTCTQSAACLLDEHRFSYSLDKLCLDHGIPGKDYALARAGCESVGVLHSEAAYKTNLWRMHSRYVGEYGEGDVRATRALWRKQTAQIDAENLAPVLRLECDLIPMLTAMRARGIRIDVERLQAFHAELSNANEVYARRVRAEFGLTLDTPKKVGQLGVACDALGIRYPLTPKTRKPSLNDKWMKAQRHPFLELVREWRHAGTIRALCVEGALRNLHNGRIHPELNPLKRDSGEGTTVGAVSGRFSCTNPNAQQASKRTALGRRFRQCFLPEVGEEWGSADVSQQEPRLMVHYAVLCELRGAEAAAEAFRRGGPEADWHSIAAALVGMDRETVKPINLGIAYGMMLNRYCRETGKTREQGQRDLAAYHARIPFVRELMDRCAAKAESVGFVTTLDGRRCRFVLWEPKRRSAARPIPLRYAEACAQWGAANIKRAMGYVAMNRVIQGSGADWIKRAMRDAWRAHRDEGAPLPLLQVHDELGFSVSEPGQMARAASRMGAVVELKVPAVVEWKVGPNWCDLKAAA